MPAELRTPAAPAGLLYLLGWYVEWASGRQAGFSAPAAITWADMQAWCALTDTQVSPWEARVLRLLDVTWLSAWQAGQPKER